MLDPELLEILVCPETKLRVYPANDDVIKVINWTIDEGGVTNRGGRPIKEHLTQALIREDGKVLYPVRDDIPIMLIDEAIPLTDSP